jgi:hypothetical protein
VNPVKTATVADAISSAQSTIEELRDELQSWLDGMPENLQSSSKAEEIQEAIDGLTTFADECEEPPEALQDLECTYTQSPKKRQSRRIRRDDASSLMSGALAAVQSFIEENPDHDDFDDLSEYASNLESWLSAIDDVNFPGMR